MRQGVDVLCVGQASYDLVFSVSHHPHADEKIFAEQLRCCGGGPAANAAVMVARLGLRSAFAGYLGKDAYGEAHYQELRAEGVNTELLVWGNKPTPVSAVLVKPDGQRALINYKGETQALPSIDLPTFKPQVLLLDGHELSLIHI